MNPTRPTLLLLSLALVLPPSAVALGARELAISTSPDFPTWRDRVTVTVSGEGFCTDGALGEPRIYGTTIEIDFDDHCPIGVTPPAPFALSTVLEPILPGEFTVRVNDLLDGDADEADLRVHDVSTLEVSHLPATVTDRDPVTFTVRGVGCAGPPTLSEAGGRFELEVLNVCDFGGIPLGGGVFAAESTVDPLPAGIHEIQVVEAQDHGRSATTTHRLVVHDAAGCVPSPTVLCLRDGRFRVEVSWRDFQGRTGQGRAVSIPDLDATGFFWFFHPDNLELTVKVLRGCSVNGRYWVFVASGFTVEYMLTVTDTSTGLEQTYRNALGETPALIPDTGAFATCP